MFTFETTDLKEARRIRIAQLDGRTATVKSGRSMITGRVRSVRESKASNPSRWIITIVPSESSIKTDILRPTPRVHTFAEDFY